VAEVIRLMERKDDEENNCNPPRTGDIGNEMMNVVKQFLIRIGIRNVEGGHRSGKQVTTGT